MKLFVKKFFSSFKVNSNSLKNIPFILSEQRGTLTFPHYRVWVTLLKPLTFLLLTFSFLLFILPHKLRVYLGYFIGWLWFDLLRIRRKIAISNVLKAFPEKSYNDAKKIARRSCLHFGLTLVEYCLLPFINKEWVEKNIEIKNLELFWKTHKNNKGVLLLSLHLGNGDLGCAALSILGIPLHLISKEFKIQWINELWFGMRKKHGTSFIAPEKSSYEILKALKEKAGIIFVLDQFTGPPLGIEIDFFKIKTGAAQGLALFALRSNLEVLPLYSYRNKNNKLIIQFEPGIPIYKGVDRNESVLLMTQTYTDKIEEIIRKYPEQWMWIHRRWKEFKH